MWAQIDPLASVLRVFDNDAKYGDPYSWCATVRHIDSHTVEILGITRSPRPSEWRAIIKCFADFGVKQIVFDRQRGDKTERRTIAVRDRLPET